MLEMMKTVLDKKIVIVGAGPTGLGAAHRLGELGIRAFRLYERNSYAGGLAASFVDEHGFTWDVGGHVQFSHYTYFERLMDDLLGSEWLRHQREAWVWILNRFVPYPFQSNIHRLPRAEMLECLRGLISVSRKAGGSSPSTLADWIRAGFGEGIARIFLLPYNFKVWAYPASEIGCGWTGERIGTVDLERIVRNILDDHDDVGWGPNSTFRFPLRGGTGEIWKRLAARLPDDTIHYNKRVVRVETARKLIHFADGVKDNYDILISTMPVDALIECSDLLELKPAASRMRHSTTHVVGVGLKGQVPERLRTKCWMYFPEFDCPFYRATVFSNYSPQNVPDAACYWSLILEVSESPVKSVDQASLIDSVVEGLLATGLIDSKDDIVSVWCHTAPHGYPTPFLGRDEVIGPLNAVLEQRQIYSRGRFGAWKYEVSNQDHSLMQGVELVNRLIFEVPEMTYWFPEIVNSRPR